ncbi:hypothetical protein [Anaerosacchariphilus polymeriproducens]|uniref:hypothetical protein n=1 Tax=Anaerosacchariphilus polymeriproducens TaxID=1812858 RepID=UPI0012D799E0|nr:hypothetical protein [Anaerosacchariphilus polymeriproducens]
MKQLNKRFEKPMNNVTAYVRCYSCYVNCWCKKDSTADSQQQTQQAWQRANNYNFSNV